MQRGMDEKRSGRFLGEADAVIADAEAEFAEVSLQFPDVALAGAGKAIQRGKDAHGGFAVDAAHIGICSRREDDLFHAIPCQRRRSSAETPNSASRASKGMP